MKKLYERLCKIEVAACCVGFVSLVGFVFLSAILRFFSVSMSWNIDLALILLAWTAFLGADIAWRDGQLVGIDIVTRNLPGKVQKALELFIYAIVFAALVVIVIFGARLAWLERIRTFQSISFLPFSFVTLSLIVAAFSMAGSTIIKVIRALRAFNS